MDGDEVPGNETRWTHSVAGQGPERQRQRWIRTVKGLLAVAAALLILLLAAGAYVTHGFIWSVYSPIYDRLLHALPAPPALLPETDEIDLNPEAPWGYRTYRVDEDHLEVVDFFVTQFPRAGWDCVEHGRRSIEREPGVFLEVDDMLLVTRQPYWFRRYWLIVNVYTDRDAQGVRIGNTMVTLEMHRNGEIAKSRYRP